MSSNKKHSNCGFVEWGEDPPIDCGCCGKTYSSKSGYLRHCRKYHPSRLQKCPSCDKRFLGKRGIQIHHSTAHGEKIGKINLSCEYCGDEFSRYQSNIKDGMRQFCSQSCMGRFNSKHKLEENSPNWKGGDVTLTCSHCGVEYTRRRSEASESNYCSYECLYDSRSYTMSGENNPSWKGGYEPYYGPNWPGQRLKAIIRDQSRCQSCGKTPMENGGGLSVHHIRRIGFYKEKYEGAEWYKYANELSNLVTLCRSCHSKWEGIPLKSTYIINV